MSISAEFKPNWSRAAIHINGCSYSIAPRYVLKGAAAIVNRCIYMQRKSPFIEDSKEDLQKGAQLLLQCSGVRKWAQQRIQAEKSKNS